MWDVMSTPDIPHFLKMKRVKHEQIQSTVTHYLKRRHFMDAEVSGKRECGATQQLSEVALHGSVNCNGNTENVLVYSSISGDATACDQQFTRLKHFVLDAVEPYQGELRGLLFPMFVHVYLELLCNGHKTPAHKFHDRHVSLLREDDSHKMLIKALRKMDTKLDVANSQDVGNFRDNKFSISLTEASLSYLMRHLKMEDNMIMLQIFNQFFHVEVKHKELSNMELTDTPKVEDDHATKQSSTTPVSSDVSMSTLTQSIQKVRDGPPCMSSICVYTFLNAYQGLCSTCVSPDGESLAAGFEDSTVSLWSLTPGHIHSEAGDGDPSRIALAADLLNVEDDKAALRASCDLETLTLRGHAGAVYKTCFTPDSTYLLSCSEDTTVRLWDVRTHTNRVCYQGHNYPVWDIDASATAGYFASSSQDRTAKLWCTERTYPLRSFIGHTFDVDCVKFHPNGNYLATGSGDKTVRLWSIQSGRTVRLFQGHRGSVMSLAFSPDGKLLASAGEDRRIRVWDLSTGHLYKELRGHSDTVYSLCFSRNSSLLASGGLDSCIWVWDVGKTVDKDNPESSASPELLSAFPTKSVSVIYLHFSKHNVLQAAGTNL
ncbi:TAF5-like RNA polymerase II p300/CBP-associated factor-associated factor 65 kDa subunit 5L [Haliotis rufescens]|uniref:TAF5-like RNA polymerase II p300/CBP-associated factor-associated factor 65 kDa subunit 5L n=1 Tax=Haliotis rufescens TaxID=6454 RepID=UPI00201ECF75|nr:TAF5-like RNA polymerase II p300/CBP-associated factor-associated factor 65 kDa subunit 5L [Haliotis rufescens]